MESESSSPGRSLSVAARAIVFATTVAGGLLGAQAEAGALERINGYCATSWRNAQIAPQDWDDCTQQVFAELLDRVSREGLTRAIEDAESHERRELKRSIWCTIQRWRRLPRPGHLEPGDLPDPSGSGGDSQLPTLDELREAVASDRLALSLRQQRILISWFDGSSIAEIAAELKLPAARVSDEKHKALKKLRRQMRC